MLRKMLVLSMAIGFVAVMISTASALFTDTATVNNNAFDNGTIDISTSPTTALVTFTNMAPGDQVTAPITVTNAGTLALRYAISSIATNADSKNLMSQLDLTIKSGVSDCSNAGFAGTGTTIYSTGDLGSTTGINLVGDPATGSQTGDRTLAASASEVLCFNVSLPSGTDNTYQNAETTATFTFAAEQTTNN